MEPEKTRLRGAPVRANYHTHTRWCDGRDTPRAMAEAAVSAGFTDLGFSSHVSFPEGGECVLDPAKGLDYARDIRSLANTRGG